MAKAKRVLRKLMAMGWVIAAQHGSHRKLKKPGYPQITFAFHDSADIGPPMLAKIAKDAGCKTTDLL